MTDLAKDYAHKKAIAKIFSLKQTFLETPNIFSEKDLEKAFNAGRDSVLKNIPKLKWIDCGEAEECYLYTEGYYTWTNFGVYTILHWKSPTNIDMCLNGERLDVTAKDIPQAKALIEEDYKMKVKHMLGL